MRSRGGASTIADCSSGVVSAIGLVAQPPPASAIASETQYGRMLIHALLKSEPLPQSVDSRWAQDPPGSLSGGWAFARGALSPCR